MSGEAQRLAGLSRRLLDRLTESGTAFCLNGDARQRFPGNLNLAFAGIEAEALLAAVPDLALSTGSACTSTAIESSYVLRALGLPDSLAGASVRIGLGRFTTEPEIDYAAARLAEAVARLRRTDDGKQELHGPVS
jgi:cysteine desulfurase